VRVARGEKQCVTTGFFSFSSRDFFGLRESPH
jgi:hypothetical protein